MEYVTRELNLSFATPKEQVRISPVEQVTGLCRHLFLSLISLFFLNFIHLERKWKFESNPFEVTKFYEYLPPCYLVRSMPCLFGAARVNLLRKFVFFTIWPPFLMRPPFIWCTLSSRELVERCVLTLITIFLSWLMLLMSFVLIRRSDTGKGK